MQSPLTSPEPPPLASPQFILSGNASHTQSLGCWNPMPSGAAGLLGGMPTRSHAEQQGWALWVRQKASALALPLTDGSGYLWIGAVLLKSPQGRSRTRRRPIVNERLGPGVPTPTSPMERLQVWLAGWGHGEAPGIPLQDLLSVWGFLMIVLSNTLPTAWCKFFEKGTVKKQASVYSVWNWVVHSRQSPDTPVYSESILPLIFTNSFIWKH